MPMPSRMSHRNSVEKFDTESSMSRNLSEYKVGKGAYNGGGYFKLNNTKENKDKDEYVSEHSDKQWLSQYFIEIMFINL